MTTETREITDASLGVAHDLGHGGAYSEYRITRAGDGYEVSVVVGRRYPRPGESGFRPREVRELLRKEGREAAGFLERLALEHRVFELGDSPCPGVFLHPTFYRFNFTDSRGAGHGFEYSVEARRHHSDAHRRLVEDFEEFFESEGASRSFYEGVERPWWRFW